MYVSYCVGDNEVSVCVCVCVCVWVGGASITCFALTLSF